VHIFLPAYDPETAIAPWNLLSRVADGGSALGAERLFGSGRGLSGAIRKSDWAGWLVNEEERSNDVRPGDAVVEPARKHVRKVFGV
jgi:hypothetical protein